MQTGLNRRLRCNTGARIMSAQTVHWNPPLKSAARQVICLPDQATTSTLSPTAEAEGEVE